MCISDWSSDVCSSDLALLSSLGIEVVADAPDVGRNLLEHRYLSTQYLVRGESLNARFGGFGLFRSVLEYTLRSKGPLTHSAHEVGGFVKTRPGLDRPDAQIRSEEHTSELQSLMRISYAVFCLKKQQT